MEIKDFILLMWRHVRYIVLGLVIGVGMGMVVSKIQAPVYEATTKVFVSRVRQQGNSDMLALSDEQLLAINLQLAKSQPVLDDVSSQLGSKVVADNIQVDTIPNTLIIQIKVQDLDPQRSAMIANLLVQTLVQKNQALVSGRYMGLENAINDQIDQAQKQINGLQTQINQINEAGIQEQLVQVNQQIDQLKIDISSLEQSIASFPSSLSPLDRITLAEKQAQLEQFHSLMNLYQQVQTNLTYIGKPGQSNLSLEDPRLIPLRSTLTLYQQINSSLVNNLENVKLARMQSGQNVLQIVSATPPKNPVRPLPALYILLGGSVGFILTVVAVLVINELDDSLKSVDQTEKLLNLPVLGSVLENKGANNWLVTLHDPLSIEAENFRALGASLEIIGTERRFRAVMIINSEPTNARTVIAANLAIVNVQQGKHVILIDGDLMHPYLHGLFGLENQMGVAEIIKDGVDVKSVLHVVKDLEGLTLIPSGLAEKESPVRLDVKKWEQLLLKLYKLADLVIVDGPPADMADTQILASKMDAVLLTIQAGHTRAAMAQETLKKLQLIGVKVAGTILNRITRNRKIKKPLLNRFKIKPKEKKDQGKVEGEIDTQAISLF